MVFNAGFVAFLWPEGPPVGNNYIIEDYDHAYVYIYGYIFYSDIVFGKTVSID